jgi:hypothetical protein
MYEYSFPSPLKRRVIGRTASLGSTLSLGIVASKWIQDRYCVVPLFAVSFLLKFLNDMGQKKAPSHSLAITTDKHNGNRLSSSIFNQECRSHGHGQDISTVSGQDRLFTQ